jgi:hypothetical protein
MQESLNRMDNLTKRGVDTLRAFMLNDDKRAWLARKKLMVRKTGVNTLAKLWIRSKRLRALKGEFVLWKGIERLLDLQLADRTIALYLKKTLSSTAKMYKRNLPEGQIRLLQIKPGYALSTIECAFTYQDLHKNGDYVALSYTWGQAIPSIPILVNGTVTMVTENLYMALLHLRKGEVTKVWVDALCINQNNPTERSIQVSQMAQVYQGASMVYVWLGESNRLTEQAFDELYEFTQHIGWDNKIPAEHFVTHLAHPKWRAISELLYRPWFRRVWIIQEILYARHALFVCGGDSLKATTFLTIINSMLEARALSQIMSFHWNKLELASGAKRTAIRQLQFMVQARNRTINPLTMMGFRGNLLDYLSQTRWAEATNPRDKIYGILGLAKDASELGWYEETKQNRRIRRHQIGYHPRTWVPFTVDYTVPPARVFTNVTRAIMYKTGSIEILKFVENGTARLNELPSWVPNWGDSSPPPTFHIPFDYGWQPQSSERPARWRPRKHYNFSNAETDRIKKMISNDITERCSAVFSFRSNDALTIQGIEFDKITAITTHTHPPDMDITGEPRLGMLCAVREFFVRLTQWVEECMQLFVCHKPYPTLQETWTVFKKIMYEEKVNKDDVSDPECFDDLLTDLRKAVYTLAIEIRAHQFGDDEPLLDILRTTASEQYGSASCFYRLPLGSFFLSGRKLAITANKYIGLVPEDAKVGDAVCVMYGSELPFILRRCGRRKFKLVGHGRLEGFDFDNAIIEKSYTLRSGEEPDPKGRIVTWTSGGRGVCTLLKNTTAFCLV